MFQPRALLLVILALLAASSLAFAGEFMPETAPVLFVGITPCRMVDTRGYGFSDQAGPPALAVGATRTFQVTGTVPGLPKQCGIPSTAVAISVNFTVTGFTAGGDLRVFPAGASAPMASIINFAQENVANSTNLALGWIAGTNQKGFSVLADSSGTHFVVDVNGYFVPRHLRVLEGGGTVKGVYAIFGTPTAAAQYVGGSINFPVPVNTLLSLHFIRLGDTPPAACPGTYDNPQANPGHLCVYQSDGSNATHFLWNTASNPYLYLGVGIYFLSTGAGSVYSGGTWAVTAACDAGGCPPAINSGTAEESGDQPIP